MNHIEKTKFLIDNGMMSVINPAYLKDLTEQQERSMLGQRTIFLAFNRFIYDLTDQQVYKLWGKYREEFRKASAEFPDDNFCDLMLIRDALQFQIAIRDDEQASPEIAEEIAMSWHSSANLAKQFDEITSDYLISTIKNWMED